MFGYITFYKDELKIKDYNTFKAYYCGLCKELGKKFNQLVRMGLSYDFAFLGLLLDSLCEDGVQLATEGCFKHFGKKRITVKNNSSISYAADMSVVFMYYKLIDDIYDDHSLLSAVAAIPYWFAVRKVKNHYPDKVELIKFQLNQLAKLEKSKSGNVDEVAHCVAEIMKAIFDGSDALKQFGYNIGRFVYIADAINDYENDIKKNRYNPYRCAYPDKKREEIKGFAEQSMLFTLAMAGQEYENLNIKKNKTLLDNIMYMGLRQRMEAVLCGDKCKRGNENGKSI